MRAGGGLRGLAPRFERKAQRAGSEIIRRAVKKTGVAFVRDLTVRDLTPRLAQVEWRDDLGLDANVNEIGLAQQRAQ